MMIYFVTNVLNLLCKHVGNGNVYHCNHAQFKFKIKKFKLNYSKNSIDRIYEVFKRKIVLKMEFI